MWIGLGSVVLGVLLWLFPDIIVGWIVGGLGWWGGVDPTLRANAEQFAKTIGGIGTVVGALFTALNYLKSRSSPSKALSNTELEQHYYTHLSEQCQRYDLGSFRDSQSAAERSTIHVTLADVYVDLFAHEVSSQEESRDKRNREMHGGMRESKLLLEWLQENSLNRLVVRGDVGSGKSSFINYLTHSIIESRQARNTSPSVPSHWLRRPVVRVLLREIGGQICPAADLEAQLLAFVRQRVIAHIKNRYPVDDALLVDMWEAFRASFESMGVLILDGLDEVSNSHENPEEQTRRQILMEAIGQFAHNPKHQGMTMVITSRNHAYGGDDALVGFRLLQLDPLNNSNRYDEFIRHWYQRVAYTVEEKASNQADAQRLLNNIAKRDSLRPLTETPLLLTLILVLDKAKVGLPESRSELYQSAVNLLLERWNKQLIPYDASLSIEERQALDVLKMDANLLLEAMKVLANQTYRDAEGKGKSNKETIVFALETVEKALKEQLQQRPGLGFAHQDSCQHFLRFRSQILVAAGDGLSFVHKSFHEYLAAAYIMQRPMSSDRDLWEMVATASKRDWWREVFLFAMNIGKAEYVMSLMKQHVLSRQVAAMTAETLDNHLGSLSLFSDAALENSLEKRVSRSAESNPFLLEAYADLQAHIRLLWEDERLAIPQRAQLGRIWGRCGDTRGVTFQRDGYVIRYHQAATCSFPLPDFDWQKIEAGKFQMGTTGEEGYADEKPAQSIRIDRPFYLSRASVTNAQYQAFMDAGGYEDDSLWQALPPIAQAWRKGENQGMELLESFPEEHREAYRNWLLADRIRNQPRFWQDNRWNLANHPVIGVSWFEALAYCEWLSREHALILPEELAGRELKIRLPTEDEWEYAARGANVLRYSCGDVVSPEQANYEETKLERTTSAGVFKGGEFGLYDMTGNVWDWTSSRWGTDFGKCAFPYEDDYLARKKEQNSLDKMECRITRGGSWVSTSVNVRCAFRDGNLPNNRYDDLGFRVV
jgi:formylglycine-generating enzyme required for sulfatase activity